MTGPLKRSRKTRQNMSIRGGDEFKRWVTRMAVETDMAATELLRVLIDLGVEAYAKQEGYADAADFMLRHLIPWPPGDSAPKAKTRRDASRERLEKRMAEAGPGQRLFPAKLAPNEPPEPEPEPFPVGEITYGVPIDADASWLEGDEDTTP